MDCDRDLTPYMSYAKLHKHREPGFITSGTWERTPGGHNLASPSWTIVPLVYHCPPSVDYTQLLTSHIPDPRTNLYTVVDGYGPTWAFEHSEGILQAHEFTMREIQAKLKEALSAMKDRLGFWRAVQCLESASSSLWSCHRDTSLDFTIRTHMGHALLRAALLECPAGQQVTTLLLRSLKEFESTVEDTDNFVRNRCTNSLRFSCIIGIGWIHFFQGNTKSVELNLRKARNMNLDDKHFRGGHDLDSLFLRYALLKAGGMIDELQNVMYEDFGYKISDREEDRFLVSCLDMDFGSSTGNFNAAVYAATDGYFQGRFAPDSIEPLEEPVKVFLGQLEAGLIGNAWFLIGASREADRAYETAMKSDSILLKAAAVVGSGNVCMRRGRAKKPKESMSGYESAEQRYRQALTVYDEIGYKEGQTIVCCNLGILYHKQKELQKALQWYQKAVDLHENTETKYAVFALQLQITRLNNELKNWKLAEESLALTGEFARIRSTDPVAKAALEHMRGTFLLTRMLHDGQMTQRRMTAEGTQAALNFKNAIKDFSWIQGNLGTYFPLWLTIFEQQKEAYEQLLWCIARTPGSNRRKRVEALVWSERSRSRLLMYENWTSFFESVKGFLKPDEATALQALSLRAFESSDEKHSWESVQLLLETSQLPGTLILEYALCGDFGILIFVIKIGHGRLDMVQVPFAAENGKQNLSDLVATLISNLGQQKMDTDVRKTLEQLYEILLKPVEEYLDGTKQLIIVPHEVLFNVPFHALIDNKQRFFIERMPLSFAESIRSLLRGWAVEQRNKSQRQKDFVRTNLVVGINAHYIQNIPVLEFAQTEAESVWSVLTEKFGYREGKLLLGDDATKKNVVDNLKNADMIHLASHGLVNVICEEGAILCAPAQGLLSDSRSNPRSNPSRTRNAALAPLALEMDVEDEESNEECLTSTMADRFSSNTTPNLEEMALKADEVHELQLCAQVVVLSACQTARGVILGEGVAGFGRALLRAGVRCTVLSQWSVSDRATLVLMNEFYEQLAKGQSVSAAMQKAMVKIISGHGGRGSKAVRLWAPFVPFGLAVVPVSKPPRAPLKVPLPIKDLTGIACFAAAVITGILIRNQRIQ